MSEETDLNKTDSLQEKTSSDSEKPLFEKNPADKKIFAWMGVGLLGLLIIVGAVLFLQWLFHDGGLAWNENYGDYGVEYAAQTVVKLRITADDEDVIKEAGVESNCDKGENVAAAEYDEGAIKWDLTNALGNCVVKVKYRIKTIEKKFTIIPNDIEGESDKLSLGDAFKVDENSEEDIDNDDLSNKEEKELKTNPELSDTDGDGLFDGYEVKTSKTDPLKADTDGDGLNDYNEQKLGLDPLKTDTKGDGIKDGERTLSYTHKSGNGIKIEIKGSGNIANVGVRTVDGAALASKKGLVPVLYDFYTDGKMEEATVTIPYTDEQLKKAGITEDELALIYYDLEKDKYESVETTVNKSAKTITAKLKHFSMYMVGVTDGGGGNKRSDGEVLFVLDNSWSMYTTEQYEKITGKEYTGGWFSSGELEGSDASGRRFSLTKQLASKVSNRGLKIGLAEFRGDFAVANKIGSNYADISSTLDGMNGKFITSSEGTNISTAIRSGAAQFSSDTSNKIIVLLTDGQDTVNLSSSANDIAKEMAQQGVKVCVVGFGEGAYNDKLSLITSMSGCSYFSSSDVNGLDEVFNRIETQLNDELVDVDGDGNTDGLLMADSGFIVNRDGFSFQNYGSTTNEGGHCFGMATFAQLYYRGKLPLKHGEFKDNDNTFYAYNLSSTSLNKFRNLYDYKFSTKELVHAEYMFLDYEYFGETKPADYRVLKDNTLAFSDTIRKEIDKSNMFQYYTKNSQLGEADQIAKYGFSYSTVEHVRLDEDKMQNSSTINSLDKNVMNAIRMIHLKQGETHWYTSGEKIDKVTLLYFLGQIYGMDISEITDAPGFILLLTARIQNGEVPVINANWENGEHAINAISIAQDIDDHNHYYIDVYDSNHPGERRTVELDCTRANCLTRANSYYSNKNEIVRMSRSEEDDLAFFEKH